jgi:tricorn protease
MPSRPWEDLPETTPIPYLRAPCFSPDGRTLAFVHAGDVWFVAAEGGEARLIVSHLAYNDRPRFSPDGRYLAFVSRRSGNGDLFVLDLYSATAADGFRQLTYHDGFDTLECWSTDGTWLYFGSGRHGQGTGLFKVPRTGGMPVSVIEEPLERIYNVAVSPGGEQFAFNNNGDPWWRRGPNPHASSQIWTAEVDSPAREFRRIVDAPGRNAWPMWEPSGDSILFVSDRDGVENLWRQSLRGGEAEKLTHFTDGRLLRPTLSPDGATVVCERVFRLWRVDLARGEAGPLEVRVHADTTGYPRSHYRQGDHLAELALSPDGRKVLFVAHGKVFADFADKHERPRNDSFAVSSTEARESQAAWSPDGRSCVYLSDRDGENELYLYDFRSRSERRLTSTPVQKYAPQFSPDGKWIAYFRRPDEIRLVEVASGEDRPFIRAILYFGSPGYPSFTWSPDSRWVAFIAQDERWFSNVYVQRLDQEQPRAVTFLSNISSGAILWAPNGRFLCLTTGHHREEAQVARVDLRPPAPEFREEEFEKLFEDARPKEPEPRPAESPTPAEARPPEGATPAPAEPGETGETETPAAPAPEPPKPEAKAPEPVEIVFDAIQDRLRFLTPVSLHCVGLRISPDGKHLIYRAHINGQPNLWAKALEEERRDDPAFQLTATKGTKGAVWFTPDTKRLFYLDEGRIQWRDFPRGEPKPLDVTAEFDVDFHREKRQMFREAWTLTRDHFYDPEFHGANWEGLYRVFWPAILGTQNQADFYELLNLMVGELRASHLGAGGGEAGPRDGYLGVRFEPAELERHGRLRVAAVLPEGPAAVAREPLRVGEYLVAVDSVAVAPGFNLWERTRYRVGKRVMLSLNERPEREGAREVAVRPVDAGRYSRLVYRDWVRQNGAYVERVSGGRLGYVHIRAMNFESFSQLLIDLDSQTHGRDGVVVDVRFNGGGYVAPFILDVLQRRSYDRSVYRGGAMTSSVNLAGARILDRPTILVTNEHSGSNTEMFSEGYRTLGLGKVVGRPTAGAVIWTSDWQLLDGSSFRLPRIQVATLQGENLEGAARPVDFDVEQPLGDRARGIDRQLDEAVKRLLDQIDNEEGPSVRREG